MPGGRQAARTFPHGSPADAGRSKSFCAFPGNEKETKIQSTKVPSFHSCNNFYFGNGPRPKLSTAFDFQVKPIVSSKGGAIHKQGRANLAKCVASLVAHNEKVKTKIDSFTRFIYKVKIKKWKCAEMKRFFLRAFESSVV